MFRTRHDRRPKELALAGLTAMAAANRLLVERFLPAVTPRGTVQAEEPGTAFVPWIGTPLAALLCVQEERVVATDHTGHDHRHRLQIPHDPHRFPSVHATVRVHEYPEGTLAVFHGPRCWARYQADGQRLVPAPPAAQARPRDRTPDRSSRVGPRCKEKIARTSRKLGEKNTGQSRSYIHRTT